MHVTLDRESFLGFIVQNNLPPNSRLRDEVDRRIKHLLLEDNKRQITLTTVLFVIESCQQQLRHEEQDARSSTTPTFNSANVDGIESDSNHFPNISYPIEAYLEQVLEEQWDRAMAFFAKRAAKCWNCGLEGHTRRNCKRGPQSDGRAPQHVYSTPFPAYQPSPQNPQSSIYPIFGAVYPPVHLGAPPVTSPQPFPQAAAPQPAQPLPGPGLSQADYYRPGPRANNP